MGRTSGALLRMDTQPEEQKNQAGASAESQVRTGL